MIVLGVITILNLNGLMDMMFDVRNIFSPLILLISMILNPKSNRSKIWEIIKT